MMEEIARQILAIVEDLEKETGRKAVEIKVLVERLGREGDLPEETIANAIKHLQQEGEVFLPKKGFIRRVPH